MSWRDLAFCRGADPDLFLPPRGASQGHYKMIREQFCDPCPVNTQCWKSAMVERDHFLHGFGVTVGIRGGTTPQRRGYLWSKLAPTERLHIQREVEAGRY